MSSPPSVIVLGGPNGSGKSTAAVRLLRDEARLLEFVNADVIARGLSAFRPEGVAVRAGRLMLQRMEELAKARESFSLESTLASRTLAAWIARLKSERGYQFRLNYVWLSDPELNIARVRSRVLNAGQSHVETYVGQRLVTSAFTAGENPSITNLFHGVLFVGGLCRNPKSFRGMKLNMRLPWF